MNLKRGFKRIVLILSLLVALMATVLGFIYTSDIGFYRHCEYNEYENDYKNITNFWLIWDANGWTGGKQETIRYLLNLDQFGREQFQYGRAKFDFGGDVITLDVQEVFPDIHSNMLYMPPDVLDVATQVAKEKAIQNAKNRMKQYEWWGERKTNEIILLSILTALGCAIVGYFGTWVVIWFGGLVVYKFIKWLILGFCEDEEHNN